MIKNLSIGSRIAFSFAFVLIVTVGVITPVSINSLQNTISTAENRELQSLFKNVKASIKSESRLAETLSAFVANIPDVQVAMANENREVLAKMLEPSFKVMKKNYGARQFQFHKSPATSFLRVHKIKKHGDDLSSFRKTVVETNTQKKTIGGIEKGVAGIGVRGVVPMFHQGKHTGSVEFGMSFGKPFFENFKKLYNIDLALHVYDGRGFKSFASTFEGPLLSEKQMSSVYSGEKISFHSSLQDKPVTIFGGVITDFSDKPIGVLEIVMDRTEYADALSTARNLNIFVGVICIGLGLLLAWLISRAIVKPITNIVDAMHDIAEGEGDLTKRLHFEGKNEISSLAQAFNLFVEKVSVLVVDVSSSINQLSSATEQMSHRTDEANRSISSQRIEIDQVATAMNQMTATVQEVARNASTAATNAREVDEAAGIGKKVVSDSVSAIKALASEVEKAAEVINKVEEDSESIGSVLDVIRGIAEQTNLLALNAAIEAARAGEQGRGFAVVADEVRTLASRTQSSTQEIQDMIERLQSGSAEAVKVMEQGKEKASESVSQAQKAGDSLNEITISIATINDMNTQIASAAEEQSKVAEEINANVVNINDVADQVTLSAGQTAESGTELAKLAGDLRNMVARFKT